MNRILFMLTLFCFTQIVASQVNFETGYFIKENNVKVECLIKNYDWNNPPNEIEYKLDELSAINKINTQILKEIKINNTSHYYKKYYVDIDNNTEQKNIVFEQKNIFFQVLIEGEASLLKYKKLYFYELNGNVKQLVYKKYIDDKKMTKNNHFHFELFNNLNCSNFSFDDIRKLEYKEKQLIRFFEEYNNCISSEYQSFVSEKTKFDFDLKVFGGLNFNTLSTTLTQDDISRTETIKNSSTGITAGIEVELKLPFNYNRWSIFMSSSYNSYKGTSKYYTELYGGYRGTVVIDDYSCIETSIGAKYYYFLNKNNKLNLNISYGNVLELNSEEMITFEESMDYAQKLRFKTNNRSNNLIRLGVGYTFLDKYSLDLNYYPTKIMSQSDANSSFAITIGYNFL